MRFTCPRCGMTSQHPWDAFFDGYCGNCHDWTGTKTRGSLFGWYFDRQGEPIDVERFGVLFVDEGYKRVALDTYPSLEDVAGGDPLSTEPVATVSTVWLGINHGFGDRRPIIFETMIFGGPFDGECTRYHTESEAVEGHRRTMTDLRAGQTPWFLTDDLTLSTDEPNGEDE